MLDETIETNTSPPVEEVQEIPDVEGDLRRQIAEEIGAIKQKDLIEEIVKLREKTRDKYTPIEAAVEIIKNKILKLDPYE